MEDRFQTSWDKLVEKMSRWFDTAMLNLPNLVIAMVVFAVFYWLSRNIGSFLQKYIKRFIKQASVRDLVSNVLSITILAIGLFLALAAMNLDEVLTSLLAGAGVAGLAVGLALQGTLSNTFSGIFLAVNEVLHVGDYVETNGFRGKVQEISLRYSKIKESDNNLVIIPNKMIIENPFKNFGLTTRIRTTLECGVAYDSDLEMVKSVATEAIHALYPPNPEENIEFHYLEFGGSSINFHLRFWVNATENISALEAKSKAIIHLKAAFDTAGIEIPFPIRTLVQSNGKTILPPES